MAHKGHGELTNDEVDKSRQCKQDCEHNGRKEERALEPAPRMEAGAEVVSAERSAQGCPRALQKHAHDEERGECNLHMRQESKEESHAGIL